MAFSSMADSMDVLPLLLLRPSTFRVVSSTGPRRLLDLGVDTGVVVTVKEQPHQSKFGLIVLPNTSKKIPIFSVPLTMLCIFT